MTHLQVFIQGFISLGLIFFLPLYFQAVHGASAIQSGINLLPIVIIASLTAVVVGLLMSRWGIYKEFIVIGWLVGVVSAGLLITFDENTSSGKVVVILLLQGIGLGMTVNTLLIGTHALIEEVVQFQNLGLAIVDEQHRFGVAQRARLWKKAKLPPHILVMTATPIPRTLAMTAYGDLDTSVIDELPPGRTPVHTVHRYEHTRAAVMDFIKPEVAKGRQAYIIFPLIEESEKRFRQMAELMPQKVWTSDAMGYKNYFNNRYIQNKLMLHYCTYAKNNKKTLNFGRVGDK